MKNEAAFKSVFKKSVRRYQGFSLSLAAPMIVGIPDLFVCMPGYVPILVEAKWLGEINREKFSRKVPFTEMQINWIKECHDVNPYTALGLVGFEYTSKVYAVFVTYGSPLFYQMSNAFLIDCAHSQLYKFDKGNLFNVPKMFAGVPIPRIEAKKGAEDIGYGPARNTDHSFVAT